MSDMDKQLVAVIMAGGMGTRFWPLSTRQKPKQFIALFGQRSLLQMSFDRLRGLVPPERILVLTNAAHVALVEEQLPELPPGHVIGEPIRRDTAAAVALAAVLVQKRFGDSVILTLTADHLIEPTDLFQKNLISAARQVAEKNVFYTFGIKPAFPATAYGYLETGARIADDGGIEHFELKQFKEKPDADTARLYVESGRFLWNSGMFVWQAATILEEVRKWLPKHFEALSPLGRTRLDTRLAESPRGGLLSHPAHLHRLRGDGKNKDAAAMRGVPFLVDRCGRLAGHVGFPQPGCPGKRKSGRCEGPRLVGEPRILRDADETVALIGVNDLIVVRSGNRTLVARKDQVDRLKELGEI